MWRSRRQSSISRAARSSGWASISCCRSRRSTSSTVLAAWATMSRSTGLSSISAMSPYQSPGPSKSSVKVRPSRPRVPRPSAPPATPSQSVATLPRRSKVAPRGTRCTRERARMAWRKPGDKPANHDPASTPRASAGRKPTSGTTDASAHGDAVVGPGTEGAPEGVRDGVRDGVTGAVPRAVTRAEKAADATAPISTPQTARPRPGRRRCTSSPPRIWRRAACPRSAHGR